MKLLAVAAAFLASSVVAVEFTNSNFNIVQGQPFTLSWSGASGPVTITLKNGPTSALQTVTVIDSSDSGSTFSWTPPAELASGTYAFQITDSSGVPNYSQQFTYSGNPTGTLGGTSIASITATGSTSGAMSSTVVITTTASSSGSSSSSASATTSGSSSMTTSGSTTTKATTTTTASSSSSSTATSASASASKPPNSNDGQRVSSPLAFLFVTIAALVYFN